MQPGDAYRPVYPLNNPDVDPDPGKGMKRRSGPGMPYLASGVSLPLFPFHHPFSLRLFHFHYVHPLPSASIPSFYPSFSTVCFPAFPSSFFISLLLVHFPRFLPLLFSTLVSSLSFLRFPVILLAYAFSVKAINMTVSQSSFLLSGLAPVLLRLSSRFRGSHFVYNRVFPFRVTPEQPY